MNLAWKPYKLQLEFSFQIAKNTRKFTDVVFTKITHNGLTGYGEASLPPYLPETTETVIEFLRQVNLKKFKAVNNIDKMMEYIDAIAPENTAAKASVDIALHDLLGKITKKPCYELFGLNLSTVPESCFTVGISKPTEIEEKLKRANDFKLIKVKLDGKNDKKIINAVRKYTEKPICVDVNEGWKSLSYAIKMSKWLKTKGVIFIEQPFSRHDKELSLIMKENSYLPIIADESFQRLADLEEVFHYFDGINVKLMKCTGMSEAYKIMTQAKKMKMKILLGCMTESSCATLAAAHLSPLADWSDLDGPFLITNNPYATPLITEGKMIPENLAGIGLKELEDAF